MSWDNGNALQNLESPVHESLLIPQSYNPHPYEQSYHNNHNNHIVDRVNTNPITNPVYNIPTISLRQPSNSISRFELLNNACCVLVIWFKLFFHSQAPHQFPPDSLRADLNYGDFTRNPLNKNHDPSANAVDVSKVNFWFMEAFIIHFNKPWISRICQMVYRRNNMLFRILYETHTLVTTFLTRSNKKTVPLKEHIKFNCPMVEHKLWGNADVYISCEVNSEKKMNDNHNKSEIQVQIQLTVLGDSSRRAK